jgi:hypothetical protein
VRTAEIRLDNINFVTAPTGWIHSLYRLDATNWRLLWRSWPDATFRLDSSSNFVTWPTIRSSSGAGNAGSFTIPDTGQPHLYFRGWVDPAR